MMFLTRQLPLLLYPNHAPLARMTLLQRELPTFPLPCFTLRCNKNVRQGCVNISISVLRFYEGGSKDGTNSEMRKTYSPRNETYKWQHEKFKFPSCSQSRSGNGKCVPRIAADQTSACSFFLTWKLVSHLFSSALRFLLLAPRSHQEQTCIRSHLEPGVPHGACVPTRNT